MADTAVAITAGTGTNIDTRTEGTNGNHRQVVVLGDPATNAGVAPVDATAGLKVDLGADNDVTVTGSVTANAGTNLNTSALALETTLGAVKTAVEIMDDWDETDRAKVNPIVGQAGVQGGSGAVSATTQRVVLATDVALPAGTNAIGKLSANSGVDIGDVDVTSVNSFVAHDSGVAGNPLLIAGSAQDMDDTAPPNRVSAESDSTRLATDRDGTLFAHPHGPQIWSYHLDTSSAQTDTTVHASPGAGLSLYVTDIVFSSGSATAINLFFEEGASKVLGPYYLEAVAGRGMHIKFQTPKKITAATALTLTTSAAIAHAVDVTGFVAQG